MVYTLISVLLVVLLIEYSGGIFIKELCRKKLKASSPGKLVLTFDDGPGDWLEERLLSMLDRENVKVTFFLHSGRAMEKERCAQRLKHSGHEIAIHTSTHVNAWKTFPLKLLFDLMAALNQLDRIANNKLLYRPPFGKLTTSTWLYLKLKQISLAFWTIDSGDTWEKYPEPQRIIDEVSKNKGGVVLLHSHDRESTSHKNAEKYVLEVTGELIKYARKNNLQICCFSEII